MTQDSFLSIWWVTGSVLVPCGALYRYNLLHTYSISSFIAMLQSGEWKHEVRPLGQSYRRTWWQESSSLKFPRYCDLSLFSAVEPKAF